jgi:hypothetical protein
VKVETVYLLHSRRTFDCCFGSRDIMKWRHHSPYAPVNAPSYNLINRIGNYCGRCSVWRWLKWISGHIDFNSIQGFYYYLMCIMMELERVREIRRCSRTKLLCNNTDKLTNASKTKQSGLKNTLD